MELTEPNKFIELLEENGFEAYLVGGYVRDRIMQISGSDIDITTNALPNEMKKVFSGYKIIETGIKHGTVTVNLNNISAEITTYRTEKGYSDNRHPDKVSFCSNLEEDLSRRDFTINALAYNRKTGIVDMFGGLKDIEKRTIRSIGQAEERFKEDALRIIRALRFASVLDFEIEKDTSLAIHLCKDLLKNVSCERITAELKKLLCGKNVKKIMMEYFDVFCVFMPELKPMENFNQNNFHHKYDLLEHTAVVTENIEPTVILRLSALLHDCAKPDCYRTDEHGIGHFYSHASKGADKARTILENLKFDKYTIDNVVKLIRIHDSPIEANEKTIRKKLNKYGEDILTWLIELQKADTLGLADEYHSRINHFEKLRVIKEEVIKQNQCFSLKMLDINGNDLIDLGYINKEIGKALNYLLDAVIDEKVENSKINLVNYLKESNFQN